VLRWESGVVQLLKLLQNANLFKIIAVEGNVDFDLLGFLLAFDVRFCSRTTVFENRILDRALPPGFGVLWYLTRHLGPRGTIDLVLNQRSVDAEEALRLKVINHLSDEISLTEEALHYAKGIAEKPAAVLRGLAKAANFPTWDFETYLSQFGGGSSRIPSR
jgi:enoyl-CoA hydratase/carnithine racemase